jgi:acetyl-CoA carboxylase carboxyl transferase subunit alpha
MAAEDELRLRERLSRLRSLPLLRGARLSGELERLQRQLERLEERPTDEEIWRAVELARHEERPYTLDYVERMFEDFVELHGDRARADDAALVTGLGRFRGATVALIGHQKGRDIRERTKRNFGMAYPEGYRKTMRVMELAERHRFPLVTLVDTPGAYPGVAAEQHGQGGAIAASQAKMARLRVPIVTCIIGEGGSGGAVAIALADRVLMQENAIYSVISPEGCAAILWRDAGEARRAAAALRPDARHCLELGVVDAIVPEPAGGAQADYDEAARFLADAIDATLQDLARADGEELARSRRRRFRSLGVFTEEAALAAAAAAVSNPGENS